MLVSFVLNSARVFLSPPLPLHHFSYQCAGSLVSRNKVVTAAHCVSGFDTSNDIVRIGGLTLTDGFQRNVR